MSARNRIEVLHGVNLDVLGRRDSEHYGTLTLTELEVRIETFARERGLSTRFFQSNHEGEFVEYIHRLDGIADGVIVNPGAWTHYSWAIHDALEILTVPIVEVHLSDVDARDEWRKTSVIADLSIARIFGKGVEGYREALDLLKRELGA